MSIPYTIEFLVKMILPKSTVYFRLNGNMITLTNIATTTPTVTPTTTTNNTPSQNTQSSTNEIKNKKITNDITDIPIYRQFKYSNYSSLNIDLLLNPKELSEWISKNNINNYIDSNNNYLNDNIKWVISLLFKKNNELTISNLSYIIDSYSFKDPNIVSPNISDIYFINTINITKQYTLADTVIKEINQIRNKINDIQPINTDELLDERVKLYTQRSDNLQILAQIYFKNILESSTNLDTLVIPKIGSLPTSLDVSNAFSSMYIVNKYYNTYKAYSKIFSNTCSIYKKNKNKKFPQISTFTNLINQISINNSNNNTNNSYINIYTDTINELYSNTTKHPIIVLLYYLLDYILILKLVNDIVNENNVHLTNTALPDLLNSTILKFEDEIILNNLIQLANNKSLLLNNQKQVIRLTQSPAWNQKMYNNEVLTFIPDTSYPRDITSKATAIIEPYINNIKLDRKETFYDHVYKFDMIYITYKKNNKSAEFDTEVVLYLKYRILNEIKEDNKKPDETEEDILNKLNDVMDKYYESKMYPEIKSLTNNASYIYNKINYAISLSMYIDYYQQNINNVFTKDSSIYSTSMENFDNQTISVFDTVIPNINKSLKIVKSLNITENLDIDTLYQDAITNNFLRIYDKDPILSNQIVNILKCKPNKINVSDASTNINILKNVLKKQSPTSISNIIYLLWFFYDKCNPIDNTPAPVEPSSSRGECKIPNLLIPSKLISSSSSMTKLTFGPLPPQQQQPSPHSPQQQQPIIELNNTLVVEQTDPTNVFYTITPPGPFDEHLLYTLKVTDGNVQYTYTDIKFDKHFKIDPSPNNILSKDDILKSLIINNNPVQINQHKTDNKKYVNLIVKGHLTKESEKIVCVSKGETIKNSLSVITNNIFDYISSFRSKKNGNHPHSGGGGSGRTQKNISEKVKIFINTNLSKITKFILYINTLLENRKPPHNTNNSPVYKLSIITSKIFIPFYKLMNRMKRDSYSQQHQHEPLYTKFIDFYNNQILHPCNIINNIYDVCKHIITDIHFIDKLYNKLSHIYKSDFFKEIKRITIHSTHYTKKYNK